MPRRRKSNLWLEAMVESLLRDAQPLASELERDREGTLSRQAGAFDELISLYLRHKRAGQLEELPIQVREICQRLEAEGGALPRPRGGRPKDEDFQLRVLMLVQDAIAMQQGERGGLNRALHDVASMVHRSYEQVRAIYYERKDDPDWLVSAKISRDL